ncbi:DNA primase [Bacillus coahuilensis]|uniref:DNA primase n=1 Tax=Bacillus coahuilensis TaxID=408580 RepID=UPI0001851146|nr:DNA primase [Bacillus coahuilensis]
MTGRIPDEKVNEIRQSVDIVDVISDYVQLKKQGRNYFGLCPFHGESTPSFSVSPDKQIFHCFGCGAGGNVLSFLMDIEGSSFTEALKSVADRSGIAVDVSFPTDAADQESPEQKSIFEAHELLSKFYHHLLVNTKQGQDALDYLQNRGFTLDTIKEFNIGWSVPSWDFTVKFLKKRGFSLDEMEEAGLVIRKEDGSYFDRFRSRIMFPIWDEKGRIIAFSGRSLNDETPKYLNSPETKVFNKSQILYNFHRARPAIKKSRQVILFEGFADVISAYAANVHTGLATMGTSLTDQHIQSIKRMAETVVLAFDGDNAGIQAAYRSAKMLTDKGMSVRIAEIPDRLDPDDYIRKYGGERFSESVIGAAVTFMAFKLSYFKIGKNLQNEGDQLKYIEEILREISHLQSPVERDLYLKQLSEEFEISYEALKQQQTAMYFSERKRDPSQFVSKKVAQLPLEKKNKLLPAYINAERYLIAYMLKNEDVTYKVKDLLSGESFNIDEHQAIFTYLLAYYEEGNLPSASSFLSFISDDKLRRLVSEIEMLTIQTEMNPVELTDYVHSVIKQQKMLTIREKEAEKKEAEKHKDYIKAAEIAMDIIKLNKELSLY